jgi:hypothetical protein
MADLFSELPDPTEPADVPGGFTLWHRSSRRAKWKRVFTGKTEREVLGFMDQAGSGDFTIQPAGKDPNATEPL